MGYSVCMAIAEHFSINPTNLANNFSLDLKEAIEETPLCLSTPNLYDLSQHNPFQPLRRSASSSELLYEKAMQRFYQAVQLEETSRSSHNDTPKLHRDYLDNTKENNSILESVEQSLVILFMLRLMNSKTTAATKTFSIPFFSFLRKRQLKLVRKY